MQQTICWPFLSGGSSQDYSRQHLESSRRRTIRLGRRAPCWAQRRRSRRRIKTSPASTHSHSGNSPVELGEHSHLTASSLPEDYPYVYRAACIALIDLTVGERVGPLCVLPSTGGIPVYVGAVIYR